MLPRTILLVLLGIARGFVKSQAHDHKGFYDEQHNVFWVISNIREAQHELCAEYGGAMTPEEFPLKVPWDESFFKFISEGLGMVPLPSKGCCAPSAWCNWHQGVCAATGFSPRALYVNFGPLPLTYRNDTGSPEVIATDWTPVFACRNVSGVAEDYNHRRALRGLHITTAPELTFTGIRYNGPRTELTLYGRHWGNLARNIQVSVGGQRCPVAEVCHSQCKQCNSAADCSETQVCTSLRTGSAPVCLETCSSTSDCLCGGRCVRTFFSLDLGRGPISICSRATLSDPDPCSPKHVIPSLNSDSEVVCILENRCPAFKQGYNNVTLSVNGYSVEGNAAVANITSPQCSTDADCFINDTISIYRGADGMCSGPPKCVLGCCVVDPTSPAIFGSSPSVCSTPARSQLPTYKFGALRPDNRHEVIEGLLRSSGEYIPLPVAMTSFVSLQPRVGSKAGDVLSTVSDEDDEPAQAISLPTEYHMFGTAMSKLYISANGYIRFKEQAPCGLYFMDSRCFFSSQYEGMIGPLVADWNPSDSPLSRVYYRILDNSVDQSALCVTWNAIHPFSTSPSPQQNNYTFGACVFENGAVHFTYGHIPSLVFGDGKWFAGVRREDDLSYFRPLDTRVQFERSFESPMPPPCGMSLPKFPGFDLGPQAQAAVWTKDDLLLTQVRQVPNCEL